MEGQKYVQEQSILRKANCTAEDWVMQFLDLEFLKSHRFPGGSDGKESACNAGDPGLIPGSGRSPGERNGNPIQYYCLESSMDRGDWRIPWGCKELDMTERLTLQEP